MRRFSAKEIFGILPPLVTPFTDDELRIDEKALRSQVRYMRRQGVHGVVPCGSTGEGYTLSADETRQIATVVSEEIDNQIPVVAGIIANSTSDAIARAKAVRDCGISAIQVTPVHYIFKTDDGAMTDYFKAIYEEVGIPIIIYNVIPWNYLSPEQLQKLFEEVPGVIGVKQSAGDLKLLADLKIMCGSAARIYSGIDPLIYPALALGTHGIISQMLCAVPGPCVELWNLTQAGEHGRALELHERLLHLWHAIYSDNRVAVTKYALSLQGVPVGRTRRPLSPPTPAQKVAVQRAIRGLLPPEILRLTA